MYPSPTESCAWCDAPGARYCERCLRALGAQLDRRLDAALRLPPLPDGRHDPLSLRRSA